MQNRLNMIAIIELARDRSSRNLWLTRLRIRDLDIPTTIAEHGSRLYRRERAVTEPPPAAHAGLLDHAVSVSTSHPRACLRSGGRVASLEHAPASGFLSSRCNRLLLLASIEAQLPLGV